MACSDQVEVAGITEALLCSLSALQALGRALAPLFGSINPSTLGNTSRTAGPQLPWVPSQVSALLTSPSGWYLPFPAVPYPILFPLYSPFSRGITVQCYIHQSDQGSNNWQKSSLPGNPGSASSYPHRQGGLLASSIVDPIYQREIYW